MRLQAQLTVGWHDDPAAAFAAMQLHEAASQSGEDYADRLRSSLEEGQRVHRIIGLDRLFRRSPSGFEPIKRFVSHLASLPERPSSPNSLICEIDAFAYAFLKGAKNFDLSLPLGDAGHSAFGRTRRSWERTLEAIARFERLGVALPADAGVGTTQYLAVRNIITRVSARDERRTITTLLVSGPSKLTEISEDLGLNYTLGPRILAAFESTGVIERRPDETYAISEAALPLAIFFLRETMGLDLLSVLPMSVLPKEA